MRGIQIVFILFLLFSFVLGIMVCSQPEPFGESISSSSTLSMVEGMKSGDEIPPEKGPKSGCYNVLIRRGDKLLLYNTYQSQSDTNPMTFSNLDEYITFTEEQRKNGLRCPILYLQEENNTQGEDVYRIRPNPLTLEGGLPPVIPNPSDVSDSSRDNPKFNQGGYYSFDAHGQDVGKYTVVDKIHDSTTQVPISDNPMDANWGGVIHSQQMVDSGKYDNNTVGKPTMVPRILAIQ